MVPWMYQVKKFNTFSTRESMKEITEEYGNVYKVISKKRKIKFSLPFNFEKEYIFKIKLDKEKYKVIGLINDLKELKEERLKKDQEIVRVIESNSLPSVKIGKFKSGISPEESNIVEFLEKKGIKKEFVLDWIEEYNFLNKKGKHIDIKGYIEKEIDKLLKNSREIDNDRVTVFFGPTGVGKTTTIVKLVNRFSKGSTHVITNDDHRMGAYAEMELYSKEFEFGITKSNINKTINLKKLKEENERILIDTAGKPNSENGKEEFKEYYDKVEPDNKVLVLTATQKYDDMVKMINDYQEIGLNGVILTKMDETTQKAFVINLAVEFPDISILYITDGQNVTGDIDVLKKKEFIEELWDGYVPEKIDWASDIYI